MKRRLSEKDAESIQANGMGAAQASGEERGEMVRYLLGRSEHLYQLYDETKEAHLKRAAQDKLRRIRDATRVQAEGNGGWSMV